MFWTRIGAILVALTLLVSCAGTSERLDDRFFDAGYQVPSASFENPKIARIYSSVNGQSCSFLDVFNEFPDFVDEEVPSDQELLQTALSKAALLPILDILEPFYVFAKPRYLDAKKVTLNLAEKTVRRERSLESACPFVLDDSESEAFPFLVNEVLMVRVAVQAHETRRGARVGETFLNAAVGALGDEIADFTLYKQPRGELVLELEIALAYKQEPVIVEIQKIEKSPEVGRAREKTIYGSWALARWESDSSVSGKRLVDGNATIIFPEEDSKFPYRLRLNLLLDGKHRIEHELDGYQSEAPSNLGKYVFDGGLIGQESGNVHLVLDERGRDILVGELRYENLTTQQLRPTDISEARFVLTRTNSFYVEDKVLTDEPATNTAAIFETVGNLRVDWGSRQSSCSAVLVSNTQIVTASHCIEGAESAVPIEAKLELTAESGIVKEVKVDRVPLLIAEEYVVLGLQQQVDIEAANTLTVDLGSMVSSEMSVALYHYPLGTRQTTRCSVVASDDDFLYHDCDTLPGSSGGAIFTDEGEIVGMHVGTSRSQLLNRAIRFSEIMNELDSLGFVLQD